MKGIAMLTRRSFLSLAVVPTFGILPDIPTKNTLPPKTDDNLTCHPPSVRLSQEPPSAASDGDFWLNMRNNNFYVRVDGEWITMPGLLPDNAAVCE